MTIKIAGDKISQKKKDKNKRPLNGAPKCLTEFQDATHTACKHCHIAGGQMHFLARLVAECGGRQGASSSSKLRLVGDHKGECRCSECIHSFYEVGTSNEEPLMRISLEKERLSDKALCNESNKAYRSSESSVEATYK